MYDNYNGMEKNSEGRRNSEFEQFALCPTSLYRAYQEAYRVFESLFKVFTKNNNK